VQTAIPTNEEIEEEEDYDETVEEENTKYSTGTIAAIVGTIICSSLSFILIVIAIIAIVIIANRKK
jgi:uncharacterized membrane protein